MRVHEIQTPLFCRLALSLRALLCLSIATFWSSFSYACPPDDYKYELEAKHAYANLYSNSTSSLRKVTLFKNKLRLQDTGANLDVLEEILGSSPPEDWAQKAGKCLTAFCVVRSLVDSDEAAYRLFVIPKISNIYFTLSVRETEKNPVTNKNTSSIWKKEELRHFEKAIRILPGFLSFPEHTVHVYRTGFHLEKTAADTNGVFDVLIYNGAFDEGDMPDDDAPQIPFTQKVLIHELCHVYDNESGFKLTYSFNLTEPLGFTGFNVSALLRSKTEWSRDEPVSKLARKNLREDFAETCAYYVTNPRTLYVRAPKHYEVMRKDVFENQEFVDASWNQPLYEELGYFLNTTDSEKSCEADLTELILKNIEIDSTGRVTETIPAGTILNGIPHTIFEASTYNDWPNGSEFISAIQKKRISEFLPIAKKDPDYCAKGGERVLYAHHNDACLRTLDKVRAILRENTTSNLPNFASKCLTEKQLSSECLKTKQTDALIRSHGNSPLTQAIALKKTAPAFPAHLRSEVLDRLPIETWFPACIAKLDRFNVSGDIVRYTLKRSLGSPTSSTTLDFGPLIPSASKTLSATGLACFDSIRSAMLKSGFELGSTLSELEIAILMRDSRTYRKTIQSFEAEVLIPISLIARGQDKLDVRKRVRSWIHAHPELRGLSLKDLGDKIPLLSK